jgi:LPXTG-motif cell wall-anchored protein
MYDGSPMLPARDSMVAPVPLWRVIRPRREGDDVGFRLHLPPSLAVTTGAVLLAGLITAPALTGQAEATASPRHHGQGHDQSRSTARAWKRWHRENDHHWEKSWNRHHHTSDRRWPKAWKKRWQQARDPRPITSCIRAAKAWSDRDRAGHRRLAKLCVTSRRRRPVRPSPAHHQPFQPVRPAAPTTTRRPTTTSPGNPPASTDVEPTTSSSPPTTVCEPATTTTSTTIEPTTTSTTIEPTTTSTTIEPTTTEGTTASTGAPPTTGNSQPPDPSYVPDPPDSEPAPAETTTNTTTGGPTTTTRSPTTSTVCAPSTSPGQLPSTGSGATPLLMAGVALLASGLSILLARRGRAAG